MYSIAANAAMWINKGKGSKIDPGPFGGGPEALPYVLLILFMIFVGLYLLYHFFRPSKKRTVVSAQQDSIDEFLRSRSGPFQ